MPDDELLALAEAGKLATAGTSRRAGQAHARPTAASSALADNFAGQWLEIRNLDIVKPDPQKFPEWNPELRDAMKTETRMFFEHVLRENRPLADFLDARYTFLNERLGQTLRHRRRATARNSARVELTTDQRGGILSQASVLTVSSYPTRTSAVIRGKYVLNNILGTPPPPPPPDVPALDESAVGTAASLRQQMEKHRANAVCASCHNRMDPLGFGLENYDGIGKWRTMDGKFPVDSSGRPAERQIVQRPGGNARDPDAKTCREFAHCLTEKMLTYALGRGLERYDNRTVDEINRKLAAVRIYGFQTLIFEIVHSLPFQSRRGEAVTTGTAKSKEIAATMITRKALPAGRSCEAWERPSRCRSWMPWLRRSRPVRSPAKPPVRMAFVYVPNGMDMRNWNPGYEGKLERAAAHSQAAGAVQGRHHAARQPDAQRRPRAARRRRATTAAAAAPT